MTCDIISFPVIMCICSSPLELDSGSSLAASWRNMVSTDIHQHWVWKLYITTSLRKKLWLSVFSSGTGVVTSVPSDAPDDIAALRDIKKKQVMLLFLLTLCHHSETLYIWWIPLHENKRIPSDAWNEIQKWNYSSKASESCLVRTIAFSRHISRLD